jgi:outer membrane protein assembly factor BamB
MRFAIPTLLILCTSLTSQVSAQYAQWRGPDRSGIFPTAELLQQWPDEGPEVILKVGDLGKGYSTPVLDDQTIYVTGKENEHDHLYAIEMDGNIKYKLDYGQSWERSYSDTRSTPTIVDGNLYLISGMGEVVCVNKEDGTIIWKVNAHEQYQGEFHKWGVAESPLVIDNMVVYTNGGDVASFVAFDRMTGEEVWKTASVGGARTYVSPVVYEYGNVRQIIASTSDYVVGIDPQSGNIDWKYYYLREKAEGVRQVTISPNSAIIRDHEIFLSKGYNSYGVMLSVADDGKSVSEKWRTEVLDTHHGHYVRVGEYIYGSNWLNNSQGNWVCLEWSTGEVMYETEWETKGPIAFADNRLYCWEERTGNLALVNPTPEKFDIVSTFKIEDGSGPYWSHPFIVDGKLLLRHGEVLMVFNIKS